MLYKYVKRQPLVIYQFDKIHVSAKKKNIFLNLFAILCLSLGVSLIIYSAFPYAQAFYYENNPKLEKTILTSNNQNFISSINYQITSQSYSDNVNRNIQNTVKALESQTISHPELAQEKGEMGLTISKLGLRKLPVVINVNSYNKDDYMPILDTKLAHFKGTSLPSTSGNTFVYGHSANELLARVRPTHPQFAFTYLNKLDIGDEILLEYKGKTYKYTLQKIKIVPPDDLSPIYSFSENKTLTLMTCWPPGVGTERLIVVAEQRET